MQRVERKKWIEHNLEEREIKAIQFQSWNNTQLIIFRSLQVSQVSQENDKLCRCYAFDILLHQFYGKNTTKCLNRNMLRNDAVSFLFWRHKKCSTRQTITLIDGCTAVNYVTNNAFQRRLFLFGSTIDRT